MIEAQSQNTLSESGHKRAAKELFLEVGKIFQDYHKSDLTDEESSSSSRSTSEKRKEPSRSEEDSPKK